MILSSEALEVVAFLKTAHGKYVSLGEISRRAGGRRRFEESPRWARNLVQPLVEAGLIEANSRGHFRIKGGGPPEVRPSKPVATPPAKQHGVVLGDDYFPAISTPKIVAGDYFPDPGQDISNANRR